MSCFVDMSASHVVCGPRECNFGKMYLQRSLELYDLLSTTHDSDFKRDGSFVETSSSVRYSLRVLFHYSNVHSHLDCKVQLRQEGKVGRRTRTMMMMIIMRLRARKESSQF